MRQAIDLEGNLVDVRDNVAVKTVDGVHYVLSKDDKREIKERELSWQAERKATEYIRARSAERGTVEEQLEFLVENGLEAYIARDNEIRLKYPKGE